MHLENDAWKLVMLEVKTICDYNRAGSPLMEDVTDPVFSNKRWGYGILERITKNV